jgi:hypothetical protein
MHYRKNLVFFLGAFLIAITLGASDKQIIKSKKSQTLTTQPEDLNLPPQGAQQLLAQGDSLQQGVSAHFKKADNQTIKNFVSVVMRENVDFGYKTMISEDRKKQHRVLVYNKINARYKNKFYNLLVLAMSIDNNNQAAMLSNGDINLETKQSLSNVYQFTITQSNDSQESFKNKKNFQPHDSKLYDTGKDILTKEFNVTFLPPVPWYKRYFWQLMTAVGIACVGTYCYISAKK